FAGGQPAALPADPLRCAKQAFAREVVHTLDAARRHGDFDELVIAAAPAFLGDIRAFMPAPLRACLRHEINKDFTGLPDPDLQRHIRQHLGPLFPTPATQGATMNDDKSKWQQDRDLDDELEDSFPASDPPSSSTPGTSPGAPDHDDDGK